jgi:HAD superfamily hydrolase (TIGR01450 family)
VERTTVGGLLDRYQAILLDAWGVLITDAGPLPGAVALIERLVRTGHPFRILSNSASRSREESVANLVRHGLAVAQEHVLPSIALLGPWFSDEGLVGARCAVLGPEGSVQEVRRAGGVVLDPPYEEAEVVVVCDESGYPFVPTVDSVVNAVIGQVERGSAVRIVVANPDLFYPVARDRIGLTTGTVALVIETLLRHRLGAATPVRVLLGKPERRLFDVACEALGTRNAVMVGDQLETDVLGAHNAGLDSALIGTGLVRMRALDEWSGPGPTWLLADLGE